MIIHTYIHVMYTYIHVMYTNIPVMYNDMYRYIHVTICVCIIKCF